MKNPYHREFHRQAHDLAVKLIQEGATDYAETIAGVARPATEAEAEALAAWLQATPEQRLKLLVEMVRISKLLSGQTPPWELPEFK